MKPSIKDPEIKLFGKNIAVPEKKRVVTGDEFHGDPDEKSSRGSGCDRCLDEGKVEDKNDGNKDEEKQQISDKDEVAKELSETMPQEKEKSNEGENELQNPKDSSDLDDDPNTPSTDEDSETAKSAKTENDQSDTTNSEQKTLKKPDKILPCPRCNSMDTKFCYYNNYNVNQPRHFCKSCQRYWTDGGTMRNVPVGAGRRKNKNSASHCRHITISEALQAARIEVPNGFHNPAVKPNGTVLSFGSDTPLCDSMTSVLNLADRKAPNGTINGFGKFGGISVPCKGGENGDDCSSGSSVTTSSSIADGGKAGPQVPKMQNINGFPPVPCLPGVPWPYPWNSAVPVPAICPPGFPMPFYPAPYWNCNMPGVPGAWSIPVLSIPSPTASRKTSSSGPSSPNLGKHSRNGELLHPNNIEVKESTDPKNVEGSILVPKTLRIDDPDEAAKSSIWATLGIKYDSVSRGGFLKAFQKKADEKQPLAASSPVLQANPAALSRSISFQERA